MTKRLHYMSLALKDIITDTHNVYCHYDKMDKFSMMREYDVQALIIDSVWSRLGLLKGGRSHAETLPLLVRKEVVFLDTRSFPLEEGIQPVLDSISSPYFPE